LKSLLHEELGGHQFVKKEPSKWTQSFQLHHHFHPGEVKVFIKDGILKVHAKHVKGDDDENCDIRESKRSVLVPEDVDRSKLHCHSYGHQLIVEAPLVVKCEEEEGEQIQIDETDDIPEDDVKSGSFRQEVDLSVFKPNHISVRRRGNDVIIRAGHKEEENGVKVSRSFHREFKIPLNANPEKICCRRNTKGVLIFQAPLNVEHSE
jgi:HSP20 family molecular chaperone IbpA